MSITETSSVPLFATYARVPSGLNATPSGPLPTDTVPVTESVAALIIVTSAPLSLVT